MPLLPSLKDAPRAANTDQSPSNASLPPSPFFPRKHLVLLVPFLCTAALVATTVSLSSRLNPPPFLRASNATVAATTASAAPPPSARDSLPAWLAHLRRASPTADVRTERVACREMEAGAQSCVFEGLACVNTSAAVDPLARPLVYLLDDGRSDNEAVPSDDWCTLRHYSSDPRYFSSRHWPILNNTVAPQMSCLSARYRHAAALLGADPGAVPPERVRWEPQGLSLVDLDYADNSHNNHMLKDILWLLDTALFQESLALRPRPGYRAAPRGDSVADFFRNDSKIYLPQSRVNFEKQTGRDVNRLTYSTILRRNLSQLYPTLSSAELHTPSEERRLALPLLEAYPDLLSRLVFHRDVVKDDNATDLVCTPRLTVGSKIGNGGHERVCRYLRSKSYELYGIKTPPRTRLGQIYYSQPPKRVVILQRHLTRRIANLDALYAALRGALDRHGVAVEVITTDVLKSAEDHVRVFSRAGVLLTGHGSQNMGQIWMPRHSTLIEIMPMGYTDYAFNLLSDSCRIWYYELQSMLPPNKTEEYYMEKCGKFRPHMMNPCTQVKSVDVLVNVSQAVHTVRFALERMGYPLDPWIEFVQHG